MYTISSEFRRFKALKNEIRVCITFVSLVDVSIVRAMPLVLFFFIFIFVIQHSIGLGYAYTLIQPLPITYIYLANHTLIVSYKREMRIKRTTTTTTPTTTKKSNKTKFSHCLGCVECHNFVPHSTVICGV